MATSAVINLVLKAKDEASSILSSTTAKVVALGTALAGFVGISAIKERVTEMTELNAAARHLGVSMEDLTAAQYAAFSGANVKPDQFIDALDEIRIKVEEFSSISSGGAADFFEVLNISADKFNKLNPLQQLQKISETLHGLSDNSAFTFLDQIGSDSLRNLLPILRNGGEEMKRLMDEAKKLNLTLTDTDTIAVNQVSNAFTQLEKVGSTAFSKMITGVAPEITALVQTITETLVGMGTEAEGTAKTMGDRFQEVFETIVDGVVVVVKIKDAVGAGMALIAEAGVFIAEIFLRGANEIDAGFSKASNATFNYFRAVFSKILGLMNSQLIEPLKNFGDAFDIQGLSSKMTELQSKIKGFQESAKQPVELVKRSNIDGSIQALQGLRESIHKSGQEFAKSFFSSDTEQSADKFLETFKRRRIENEESLQKELAARQDKANQENIAKLQKDNAAAAATIAATQAQLQADLAKREIEITISKLETKKQIELAALTERARVEKLSSVAIADEKFRIEVDAARRISAQKKLALAADLKMLEASLAGQQASFAANANSKDQATISTQIVALQAQITAKKAEELTISADLVNQEALLKSERAASLGQLREQIEKIKEDAVIELKAIGGDQLGSELAKLEQQYRDTIRDIEALGDDSTAITKLISAKKAQAEMAEIERQYSELKSKLEKHQISPLDYLGKVNDLEQRGEKAAGVTGNSADLEKVKESAKAARAEVFDLATLTDTVAGSMQGGLEGLFTDFISGTKSAKEAFSDFSQGVLTEISKIIAKLLIQLAIQSMLTAMTGGTSGGASGLLGMLGAGVKHSGGGIGDSGRSRNVPMAWFARAPRYHTGGEIGLKPNEIPIIAERGEEMLTASDPRHRNNLSKNRSGQSDSAPRVTVNNLIDSQSIASVMEGTHGSAAIMNVIRANRNEIKNM